MTSRIGPKWTPLAFGVTGLAVTFAGWLWFVLCFSASHRAWWNSLATFFVVYLVALLFGIRGIPSWAGIAALIFAGLSLACVAVFLAG
jgi:hypothetical protein